MLDIRCLYVDATSWAVGVLGVWRGVEDSACLSDVYSYPPPYVSPAHEPNRPQYPSPVVGGYDPFIREHS